MVIEKDGRYLLGKRSLWKKTAPGMWCPVSGKIENGESETEAVCRESWEEVGLRVQAIQKLGEINTRDGSVCLHWWLAEVLEGEAHLKNDEHSELGWFTISEIEALSPTFSEDVAIFRTLTQSANKN